MAIGAVIDLRAKELKYDIYKRIWKERWTYCATANDQEAATCKTA
jgi:hypothetical protein